MSDDRSPEQVVDDLITNAIAVAEQDVDDSRENSLVKTKLEEARMWNTYDIQKKEGQNREEKDQEAPEES